MSRPFCQWQSAEVYRVHDQTKKAIASCVSPRLSFPKASFLLGLADIIAKQKPHKTVFSRNLPYPQVCDKVSIAHPLRNVNRFIPKDFHRSDSCAEGV